MAATSTSGVAGSATKLDVSTREATSSRAARRLRRGGQVPGVLYGGDAEPVSFAVEARELRVALAAGSAVLDVSIDGAKPSPAVLKEIQRHPVRGNTIHVDFLRVRLDRPIHAIVPLELHGADDAPGVKEGGILEQITRELNVEALPTAIPPAIVHEVSEMQIGDTLMLSSLSAPEGVTLLDDPEETVVATLTPPRLQAEAEAEMEAETELVGEEGAAEEAEEAGAPEEGEGGAAAEGGAEE
jgi:large subunit ribosomal protein L25